MNSIQILVVDDEPVIGKDVQRSLQGLGYSVPGIAADGPTALEMTRRINPDLIIMDVRLNGEMDGIETAMEIKRAYGTPVIYLTALADEETISRAKETEPYGFLLKPFNERELQSVVEMALARSISQQRLHRSREQFMSALRSMADGVIATNLVGNITYMNPLAEELTGWPAAEALGRPLGAIFRIQFPGGGTAPALPDDAKGELPRAVLLTTRSGAQIPVEDNSAPLKDEHGSLTGLVVVFRKRPSGGEASEAEASLGGLVEGIGDPLIALDAGWHITFVNRQAATYFGKRPDEMLGRDIWDEFPEEVHANYYHEYYQAMSRRERRAFEIRAGEKGTWFEVTAYPFGEGLLILLKDITARKTDEERLRKVEKLESLGLLARGFAHDFNNLLTVLLGNVSLAEVKAAEGDDVREEIEMAKRATLQAQGRVQQLLTFARGGAPVRTLADPGELLRKFLAAREPAPGIHCESDIAPDLWWAKLDRAQFGRLLENLLRNAEQAMPDGGVVRLRATNLPANPASRAQLPGGFDDLDGAQDYLLVEISDTGGGIVPDDLSKVFEPYFTTRQDANATGIGLTVCESIARGHHGAIAIESTEGRGTTVRVCLPALGPGRDEIGVEEVVAPPVSGEPPRVLILEDDAMIRRLLMTQLRQHGYEVVETAEGTRTIARFREARDAGAPFDLLIMDLSIPNGMGGLRALEEIRQMEPGVLAIVSSGYSDDPVMADPRKFGFSAVLPKPYLPADLIKLVGSMVNGRQLGQG